MKEKIIDTAGRTWQFLGQEGETEVNVIPKRLKEKNDVVFQSLGWLAREDKIGYSFHDKKTFVSLVDSERNIYDSVREQLPPLPKASILGRAAKKR